MTLGFPEASRAMAEYIERNAVLLEGQARLGRELAAQIRAASGKAEDFYTPEQACQHLGIRATSRAARHAALVRESKGKGWYRRLRRNHWVVDAAAFRTDLLSRDSHGG